MKNETEQLEKENEQLRKAVVEAKWLIDHIMGEKKRIDWGKSFNIDWKRLNEAMIVIERVKV